MKKVIATRWVTALAIWIGALASSADPAFAAWTVVFRDDGRPQWTELYQLVGPPCNVITRNGASLRVQSCSLSTPGSQTAMLWPRIKLGEGINIEGGLKIQFNYTHYTADPVRGGSMSALMILASGDGTTGYPVNVTRWDAQCCKSPGVYGKHMFGLQLNFASKNDPRGDTIMRLRGLKGTTNSYEQLGESSAQFPFLEGRTYRMTAVRVGSRMTIKVRDNVTLITRTFRVTHPYIGSLKSGWIGFRQMQARDSEIANFKMWVGS